MLKSLRVYLLGALDLIHAIVDLSIASAGSALEIIGVESKNMPSSLSHHLLFLPYSQDFCRLSSRWRICLCKALVLWCGLILLGFMYAVTSPISLSGQTALRARPIKYSGIQPPQRINRGLGYLCTFVDLDLNDLS